MLTQDLETRPGALEPGTTPAGRKAAPLALLAVLGLAIGVRAVIWAGAVRFEDHDSFAYLEAARVYRSLDGEAIAGLNPDLVPLYSLLTAAIGAFTGDLAVAARTTSLLAGAVALLATAAIAWRLSGAAAGVACALLLATHPLLAWLSISVLSEASYIAAIYLGLWLFWRGRSDPRPVEGAVLGLVFGLAFVTRLEGLLFLAVVPAWQGLDYLTTRPRAYDRRRLAAWTAAFVAVFVAVGAVQVAEVSRKMGGLALNGRQAWQAVLVGIEDRSYEEAVYGLDHDPAVINLWRAKYDPELRARLSTGIDAAAWIKLTARNLSRMQFEHSGRIAGPLVLMIVPFGVIALVAGGRRFDALVALSFFGVAAAAPLVQSSLADRHLAVMAPMLCILAAIGMLAVGDRMSRALDCRISPAAAAWLLAAATAAAWVVPLYDAAAYPPSTMQYDPEAMQRATDAVNAAAASDGVGAPRLTSRMAIVPYYTEAAWFQLPYTDLQGLTRYLSLNGITYMLLQHERLGGRPFGSAFAGGQTPAGFELLHRDVDADGQLITLHRFTPGATEQ